MSFFPEKISQTTVFRSFEILGKTDRNKLLLVMLTQVFLSFLDLAGVALMGVIGALTVSGIRSESPGKSIQDLLNRLGLSSFPFQGQVAIIGTVAVVLFLVRTLSSMFITRKTLHFLSRRGTSISEQLTSKLLAKNILEVQSRSIHETIFALTSGVQIVAIGVIGAGVTLFSDAILLAVLLLGLFVIDAVTASVIMLIFGLISVLVYKSTSARSVILGELNSKLNIESYEKLFEAITLFREITVRDRKAYYAEQIHKLRTQIGFTNAEISFMPNISKYVTESAVIIGALLICGMQFILADAIQAISTLAIFLAAGSRVAPAVMRMQQGIIVIKSNVGSSAPTLDLFESFRNVGMLKASEGKIDLLHTGFVPSVKVSNLNWAYPGSNSFSLSNLSMEIHPGDLVAIVGPSGAGKSTLADILLGVIPVEIDSVEISGKSPLEAIQTWPGAISYVPQDVAILNGTVKENIALGYALHEYSDEWIWQTLEIAQLHEYVRSLPNGLDSQIGENGLRLSGGQRQRLGIARALITNPRLLVLDEATSSLDGQTEAEISSAIQKLKGNVTVVVIAHRLSTLRESNRIFYLEKGVLLSSGTFEEVRNSIPGFDRQASLMGL